jgi:tRNA (cmo5U34)-methyltransferase
MADATDDNATIWKSGDGVSTWLAGVEERELKYRPQWDLMGQLLPFNADDAFTVLDLGAGTGAAARTVLDRYPRSTAILADFSPAMMDEAASVMQPYAGRVEYVEFDMLAGEWPAAIPDSVDAVVSSLCIHHLPDERKQGIFAEILLRLVPGGWYFNLDPISTQDPAIDAVWLRTNDRLDPAGAHKRLHRTPEEHARYENHIRYIIPLDRQLGFLRSAGFQAVDVYWKQLDYVIYGGSRPASTTSNTQL